VRLPDVSVASGEVQTRRGPVALRLVQLGRLQLTTGRLVATDPIVFADREPFTARLPRGGFPVEVCASRWLEPGREGDEQVAWARLLLDAGPVERWTPLRLAGEERSAYPVDAGLGCFMDAEAALAMEADLGDPQELLLAALGEAALGAVVTVGKGKANVALFRSGAGDGVYATWLGVGVGGAPRQVVTDFGLLPATVESS
jgi:hypothetical protein